MRVLLTWVLLAVAAASNAAPSSAGYKIKETFAAPLSWKKGDAAPADAAIVLHIALPRTKFPELEQHLQEISDPFHERYGQHLSKEEVNALLAPDTDSITSVNEWLASHGISESALTRSASGDTIKVEVPISLAEKMLDTKYHVYTHTSGRTAMRTTTYSLPENLHNHVELIQPTTYFSDIQANGKKGPAAATVAARSSARPIKIPTAYHGQVDASCNTTITISCLQQLYNAVGYVPSAKTGNQVAVTGYLEQNANLQDLNQFFAAQRPEAVNSTVKFVLFNGGENNQTLEASGIEASLDTQFAYGMSYPIPATFFSTGGRGPEVGGSTRGDNEPHLEWIESVLAMDDPPQSIGSSYGEPEKAVPPDYAHRVCEGFAALGARGITVMSASGDGGVGDGIADSSSTACHKPNSTAKWFSPIFPGSCPYVTSVGATHYIPETMLDWSGSGFSDFWSRPSYQDKAVTAYFNKLPNGTNTYAGYFNMTGRAFPDIAAQGDYFSTIWKGKFQPGSGTSASVPVITGLVAMLNDARIKAGLSTLGFMNPLLYAILEHDPKGFNDITTGHNIGCGTQGFPATKGWDAVSGVGTPNFAQLKQIVTRKFFHTGRRDELEAE